MKNIKFVIAKDNFATAVIIEFLKRNGWTNNDLYVTKQGFYATQQHLEPEIQAFLQSGEYKTNETTADKPLLCIINVNQMEPHYLSCEHIKYIHYGGTGTLSEISKMTNISLSAEEEIYNMYDADDMTTSVLNKIRKLAYQSGMSKKEAEQKIDSLNNLWVKIRCEINEDQKNAYVRQNNISIKNAKTFSTCVTLLQIPHSEIKMLMEQVDDEMQKNLVVVYHGNAYQRYSGGVLNYEQSVLRYQGTKDDMDVVISYCGKDGQGMQEYKEYYMVEYTMSHIVARFSVKNMKEFAERLCNIINENRKHRIQKI